MCPIIKKDLQTMSWCWRNLKEKNRSVARKWKNSICQGWRRPVRQLLSQISIWERHVRVLEDFNGAWIKNSPLIIGMPISRKPVSDGKHYTPWKLRVEESLRTSFQSSSSELELTAKKNIAASSARKLGMASRSGTPRSHTASSTQTPGNTRTVLRASKNRIFKRKH